MTRHDKYNLSAVIRLFYIFLTDLFNYGDELDFCSRVMKLWLENSSVSDECFSLRAEDHFSPLQCIYMQLYMQPTTKKQLEQLNPQRGRRLQLQPAKCLLSTKSALAPALQPSLDTRYFVHSFNHNTLYLWLQKSFSCKFLKLFNFLSFINSFGHRRVKLCRTQCSWCDVTPFIQCRGRILLCDVACRSHFSL